MLPPFFRPCGLGSAIPLLVLLGGTVAFCGGAHAKEVQNRSAPSSRIAQATRVDHAPKLDGTLDDPLWQKAVPITDFFQREPYEGQPPSELTEVRMLYTKTEVYFGIRCRDSEPRRIVERYDDVGFLRSLSLQPG